MLFEQLLHRRIPELDLRSVQFKVSSIKPSTPGIAILFPFINPLLLLVVPLLWPCYVTAEKKGNGSGTNDLIQTSENRKVSQGFKRLAFDGLIAAKNRLYLATMDGRLVCLDKAK